MVSEFILGAIALSDIDGDMDLQVVPEQVGPSQLLPSQTLLPQVAGLHVIDISDVIDCDDRPDTIESYLPVNFPNAATETPRTKTLAMPSQTCCVFIFILPYSTKSIFHLHLQAI